MYENIKENIKDIKEENSSTEPSSLKLFKILFILIKKTNYVQNTSVCNTYKR